LQEKPYAPLHFKELKEGGMTEVTQNWRKKKIRMGETTEDARNFTAKKREGVVTRRRGAA